MGSPHTATRERVESAKSPPPPQPLPRLSPSLTLRRTPHPTSREHSPSDQCQSPLMPLPLDSSSTSEESSSTSAEPTSITESLPSDTELRTEPISGSSETPGVPSGESTDMPESSDPTMRVS